MIPGFHLHGMSWLENVEPDAIVLASTYGDGIGRGEFSGKHLLELNYLVPYKWTGLLHPDHVQSAILDLKKELGILIERAGDSLKHAQCEHQMQAHYIRSLCSHAMNIISNYCSVYQMFTHPDVYQFMWSLHPAIRSNTVYALLLDQLEPQLLKLPWAQNNRALRRTL